MTSPSIRCAQCGAENPSGARFCNACGGRLDAGCPACGHGNAPGSRFCNECGQPLAGAPAAAAARFASPQAYTPPHLAEKILTSRASLAGERKHVTVLFADLKASLELLADRDPEEARALLDPVLERMMDAVHRYEGTVNQVLGDGVMAMFGAPLAHEDHAVRACYAALRMQEGVTAYGDELQRTHGVPLQIRVGLNSGEVVVRSIGTDLHTDYLPVGQTTHLAARMEQMAKPGSVLITAETFRLAEGYVQARALGPVPVRGLETPIDIYELHGAQRVRSRLQAAAARGWSPFVDRESELDQLRRALEQAQSGHGQVVAVVGESGVGKTRLFYEFTRSPRTEGWLILESSAVSYGHRTPYLPILDLLRSRFQIQDGDPAPAIQEKVAATLAALDERLKDAIAPVLWLLDALPADDAFGALGAAERRSRTLEALRGLLIRESRRQPVLLVAESLHWIDAESQAFLDALVEGLPGTRLLVLASYRPEYQHGWGGKSYYRQLPLGPLSPESARALFRSLVGGDPGLQPLETLLATRTEGNPFFLEESVRRLVETHALTGQRGAYRLAKPIGSVQVPGTIQAVIAARIDRLPPEEKELLEVASVIGKAFAFPLLAAVAEVPEADLRRGLVHLQGAEFLYEASLFPEVEYTFRHVLSHDVAYGSLLHERRRALHVRILDAIERLYANRLDDHVDRLAHHALHGEVWEKAHRYLRQAGAKASRRSANREAVAWLEQALAALGHLSESHETIEHGIDIRLELRPLLLQLGRLPDVLALSRDAERLAQRLGDDPRLARVYTYLINYHYLKGEPERAIEYGQRCLAIGQGPTDLALHAIARRYMGHSYHAQGEYGLAESVLEQNVQALETAEVGDFPAETISYVGSRAWLAFTLVETGAFDRAQAHVARAQRVADTSRQAYAQAIAWTLGGLVWLRRGHLEAAVQPLERSLEACRERDLAVWRPIPSSLLGLTLARLGRVAEGLSLLEDGVSLSRELGVNAYLPLWMAQLAEGRLLAGDFPQAEAAAREALDLALAFGERGHEAWIQRLLGEIAARRQPPDREQAERHYRDATALASERAMRPLLALVDLGLGRLYRQAADRPKADEYLTRATANLCEMDMRYWVREAWTEVRELGRLLVVGRDHPGLYEYLTQVSSGEEKVVVILDRRQGERRQRAEPPSSEQRHGDRRRPRPDGETPGGGGFIIIRDP